MKHFFLSLLIVLCPFVFAGGDDEEGHGSSVTLDFTDSERVVMGGKATIDKHESVEKLVIVGGKADVYGTVRDLVVVGGYLNLHEGAVVLNELVVVGGYVDRDQGVEVLGKQVNISIPVSEEGWEELSENLKNEYLDEFVEENYWLQYLGSLVKVFALLILAALARFLAPGFVRRTTGYLRENFVWSGLMGVGTTLLVLPITMFLVLSLVGIPLLPLQFSLLIMFILYGEVFVANWLVKLFSKNQEFSLVATALGLVLLECIGYLPFLGFVKWLLILAGFGATSRVFNQRIFAKLND